MITARLETAFDLVAARLAQRAAALTEAEQQTRLIARSGGVRHWRKAALLWPLFVKG